MGEPRDDRVVDVVLAEYNALRAEILLHVNIQAAVVGVGLTAIGVLVGFTVKEGVDRELLLIVPPVCLFVALIYSAETYRSAVLEIHIYRALLPALEDQVGPLPVSWERPAAAWRADPGRYWQVAAIDAPALAVFVMIAVLAQVTSAFASGNDWLVWSICLFAAILTGLAPLLIGLQIKVESERALGERSNGPEPVDPPS